MPSDPDLGLPAGFSAECACTLVAIARLHHVVAAARADLGPAHPSAVNAPGGGVTEEVDLVRFRVHGALRALEVDSGDVEDRGC